jgi:hypothetical protein
LEPSRLKRSPPKDATKFSSVMRYCGMRTSLGDIGNEERVHYAYSSACFYDTGLGPIVEAGDIRGWL